MCYVLTYGGLRLLKHAVVAIFFFPILVILSWVVGQVFLKHHGLNEYLRRLDTNMDDLTKLSLNDLYDEYLPAEYYSANAEGDIEAGEDSQ
jgi:hypothetical protein